MPPSAQIQAKDHLKKMAEDTDEKLNRINRKLSKCSKVSKGKMTS